jgi:3-oxoadipate enol-lactonase
VEFEGILEDVRRFLRRLNAIDCGEIIARRESTLPFIETETSRTHYLLEGTASSPTLVFSNSLGTNLSMWDPQTAAFSKKFQLLRYDTRGHGNSSVSPGSYSIGQLGKDVLALLDELHLDRVHFCGLSMGGMIGMWLGANAPNRLNKLALCSTAAKIGTPEMWNTRIETVRKNGMKSIAHGVMERWFTPAFRAKDPLAVAACQRMVEGTNPEGYAACCAAVRDFDFREHLQGIRVPMLVMSGAHDPATTPSDGRFLTERTLDSRYVELNAAHLSNIEDRDQFNAALAKHLA